MSEYHLSPDKKSYRSRELDSSPWNFQSTHSKNVDAVMPEDMIEEEPSDSLVSDNMLSEKQYSN